MNNISGLLQGVGIFVCIGAVLLVVLVAFAARSLFKRSNRGTLQNNQDVYSQHGNERPRYDSDRIESSGGFGSNRPRNNPRRSGFGLPGTGRPSSGDRLQDYRRQRGQTNDPEEDDNIHSRGGFGG